MEGRGDLSRRRDRSAYAWPQTLLGESRSFHANRPARYTQPPAAMQMYNQMEQLNGLHVQLDVLKVS